MLPGECVTEQRSHIRSGRQADSMVVETAVAARDILFEEREPLRALAAPPQGLVPSARREGSQELGHYIPAQCCRQARDSWVQCLEREQELL